MDEHFVSINGLEPFAQALGLAWPVEYFLVPTESTCRITSDPAECRHEVWLHSGVIQNPEDYLCDLVHELCHGALAEKLDPAFATIYFSRRYAGLTGKAEQQFSEKARQLYLSWAHIDVWVDEYRHGLFPELTMADHESFLVSVKSIAKSAPNASAILEKPESLMALAIQLAETKRLGLDKQDFSEVLNCLSRDGQKTVSRMRQFYEVLPRLTFQPKEDLAILLNSVQASAKKLALPIAPQIIEEDGRRLWLV